MTSWTTEELRMIGESEELRIAALRPDGTPRNMVTIWVVRLGNDLYVRSVNGRFSGWFRGVQTRHEGCIHLGDVETNVEFVEESDPELNNKIDAAYASKYRRYAAGIIQQINSPGARAATLRLVRRACITAK
jgi:hypothetical protein